MDAALPSRDYAQLRAFAAIAASGSFTRAAASLGVSPSALSQTIRTLEEALGVQLLRRTTRSLSLTESGEALLARITPALSELDAALTDTRRRSISPAGTVRIHSFRFPASLYISPILQEFHVRYPGITLDITLSDAVEDFIAGNYDIALRIGEVVAKDMIAVRLSPDIQQIAVASPAYLAAHGAPAHPRDLAGHACIGWRWPGHQRVYAWEFHENGKWFEVPVTGPLIASTKEFGLQAAIDGVGIAFTVQQMAQPAIDAGQLIPLLAPWSAPFPGYCLCYPAQRQMAPALRAFVNAVRAHAIAACIT